MSDTNGPEERRPGTPPPPPGTPADGAGSPADDTTPLPPPASTGGGGQDQPPPRSGSGSDQPPPTWGSGPGLPPPGWDAGSGGASAQGGPAWSPGPETTSSDNNAVALVAMVTGIVSLLFAVVGVFVLPLFLSIPGGVVAIVLGVIGRRRASAGGDRSGQAITGLITGVIALVVSAIWISVVVVLGSQFVTEFSDEVAEFEACIEETGDEDLCAERFSDEVFERVEP